ncbi:hypothetical protein PISMIDRAFT_646632, partial [Pisolithus microcarpus 441]
MFLSKSCNKHIWDQPWLLNSAMYKLNRLRAPDGGVAMSILTHRSVCTLLQCTMPNFVAILQARYKG